MRLGRAARLAGAAAAVSLCGCSLSQRIGASINPDSLGTTDRCAYFVKLAMPGATLDIDERSVANVDLTTAVARIEATRTDLPEKSPAPGKLAAECEFKGGVLTAFRWTQGGPAH